LAFDLRHPEQVTLSPRAEKLEPDSWMVAMRRRFNPEAKVQFRRRGVGTAVKTAPIIAVAIDVSEQARPLAEALRTTVGHVMATVPNGRVACINVLKLARVGLETTLDNEGHNKHVQRLAELTQHSHWVDEILITRADLEEKASTAAEMASKLDELQLNHQYQLKLSDMAHIDKTKAMKEEHIQKQDLGKKRLAQIMKENEEAETAHKLAMVTLRDAQDILTHDLEIKRQKEVVLLAEIVRNRHHQR
jgi:hypothetical protein